MEWMKENLHWILPVLLSTAVGSGGLYGIISDFKKNGRRLSKKGTSIVEIIIGIAIGIVGCLVYNAIPHDDPSLIRARGQRLYDNQEYEKAIKLLAQAAEGFEVTSIDRSVALYYKGLAHLELEEYDQARKCFNERLDIARATGSNEYQAYAYNDLGRAYEREERLDEAKEKYAKAYWISVDVFGEESETTERILNNWKRASGTLDDENLPEVSEEFSAFGELVAEFFDELPDEFRERFQESVMEHIPEFFVEYSLNELPDEYQEHFKELFKDYIVVQD